MSTNIKRSYASFLPITRIPYKIIEKLALNDSDKAENLWKLLKYTDMDSISKANLTFEEKMDIVWTPEKTTSIRTQDTFNVFLKPLIISSLNDSNSQTQLRIFRYSTVAKSQWESILMYEFNITVNEASNMVYNEYGELIEKTDLMEAYLIDILNMSDLGVGINFLRFDKMDGGQGQCQSIQNINNSKSIYGRTFLLTLRYYDNSMGGECSG